MENIIKFSLFFILFDFLKSQNFTEKIVMKISVDDEYKGNLYIGLYNQNFTNIAAINFLSICLNKTKLHNNNILTLKNK